MYDIAKKEGLSELDLTSIVEQNPLESGSEHPEPPKIFNGIKNPGSDPQSRLSASTHVPVRIRNAQVLVKTWSTRGRGLAGGGLPTEEQQRVNDHHRRPDNILSHFQPNNLPYSNRPNAIWRWSPQESGSSGLKYPRGQVPGLQILAI